MPSEPIDPRISRNPALLCAHHALMMSLFPMAILTLYQQQHLGLSMTEIMWLQALFGLSLAVFEFPSGYLADRIGYRTSLLLASAFSAGGWMLYSFAGGFLSVAIAEMTLGFSLSLISGTNSALLFESLSNVDREGDFALWFGRARFFGQLSEGSAALGAGLLFAYWTQLPFLMMVGVWVLNLGIAFMLVEPRFHRHAPANPFHHVGELVSFVAKRAPRLRAVFAASVAFGLATFVPVWLITIYSHDAGVPVAWLGPIWAAANYVVALASLASDRLTRQFGVPVILGVAGAAIAVGYFGLGFQDVLWGFIFYFAFCASRGLTGPALAHAEQLEMPSGDRASLVSLRSLLFRMGFVVVGPLAGVAIDAHGIHWVLTVLGVFFSTFCAFTLMNLMNAPEARGSESAAPTLRGAEN